MSTTVVYSQGYLPIDVIPLGKAVKHLVMGTARLEQAHPDRVFRSQHLTVPAPRSIVLTRAVSLSATLYQPASLSNENLFERDGRTCQYCSRTETELKRDGSRLSRDHVVPLSRGGKDVWRNVTTACEPCNNAKGDRTVEGAGMRLLSVPRTPTAWELVELRESRRARERSARAGGG